MPERLPYDEAMLFAATRLKIQDPELKQGQVEKVTVPTVRGTVTRPWGIEGGFAVVYKFRTKSGKHRALRCFRVPMNPDTQFRYEHIGPYFQAHAGEITAGFKYHDTGILVKEQGQQQGTVYPVIEMDWIDGVTLLDKVDELCKKRDRQTLQGLCEQWLNMLLILRRFHIAHGDLAGVNVMVKTDGRLVLIDYDGVYIPDFANLPQVLLGQADYQHPQMAARKFSEDMDHFSAMVIYTALLALSVLPELWDRYAKRKDGKLIDTNILFSQQDFKEPEQSVLMRDLQSLSDPRVKLAVQELRRMCREPVDLVRFPVQLIDPDYANKQALKVLEAAIGRDDDEQIALAWTAQLEQYTEAQKHSSRVQLAQQRVKALSLLRNAFKLGNVQQIAASYDPVLDLCKNVTGAEREQLSLVRSFQRAWNNNDDEALISVTNSLQRLITITFTPDEQEHITFVREQQQALRQLREALTSKDITTIASAYQPDRYAYKGLNEQERQQAERARNFFQAYQIDNDKAIIDAYEAIENFGQRSALTITAQQQQRAELARRRLSTSAKFRVALTTRNARRIALAYDPVLDGKNDLTQEEQNKRDLSLAFSRAYDAEDDEALIAACERIEQSSYSEFFTFSAEERQKISYARYRLTALQQFRAALKNKKPREIIAAYSPLLDGSKNLTSEERRLLSLARRFVEGYDKDNDEILFAVAQQPAMLLLTEEEQQRLEAAQARYQALLTFRHALAEDSRNATRLLASYDAALLGESQEVTQGQRARVELARSYMEMYQQTQKAIAANDDDAIRRTYKRMLDQEFVGFTAEQRARIEQAVRPVEDRLNLEEALANKDNERAIRIAREIERKTRRKIDDDLVFRLNKAVLAFIKNYELTNLRISLQEESGAGENYAVARWTWPPNDLVEGALIVWNTEDWPRGPHHRASEIGDRGEKFVTRKVGENEGEARFSTGLHTHIYVQIYAAIYGWGGQWRYSRGEEATSRCEAGNREITWRTYR